MRRLLTLAANRIDEIGARLQRQSNAARAAVAGVALVSWIAVIGLTWFSVDLIRSTPRKNELSRVGDMAQATTLLASDGRPAFTIFKEQRLEVPLSQVSPLLVKAVVAIEDQRFYEHRGVDLDPDSRLGARELAGRPSGAGRQHYHPTARAPEFPHARQDGPPQAAGSDRRRRARVRVLEGSDPRAVPEQGVFRRRAARRRGGRARLSSASTRRS